MFFPQQQQPEPLQIAPAKPSKELKFRRNLTKISSFLGYASLGALATTLVGMYPAYWGLYVLGGGLSTVALVLFPGEDRSSQFYGALSLLIGSILPWWGLIKPIHVAGAIALFLIVVFAIGAIGGGGQ